MLLNLSDLSDEPLQSQISRQIRAKILTGELEAGFMLPSIRALAREQHVSVITVQRGYDVLEQEGLIHSRRGKGFFVSEIQKDRKRKIAETRLYENLEPLIRSAKEEGMDSNEIISVVKTILNSKH
ncbi:GntR family transcriptional regulator [Bacteroidota bacterium]